MSLMEPRTDFEPVAASTSAALGPVGNVGDILVAIVITPGNAAAGDVSIKDGTAGSSIPVFSNSGMLSDLKPFTVYFGPEGMRSKAAGGWQLTTGASVTAVAIGRFT